MQSQTAQVTKKGGECGPMGTAHNRLISAGQALTVMQSANPDRVHSLGAYSS